ncbi:hypothetical protein [Mycolicibacterium sediminis]|nr:hypothetical protein [Mycolicibacterium sediminis]
MPRGQGIYENTDEPDGDDRGGTVQSADDVDTSKDTPDVDTDQGEPTD